MAQTESSTNDHEHVPTDTRDYGYAACVRAGDCVPRAHGGIASHHRCACGALRVVNINGRHYEVGEWQS